MWDPGQVKAWTCPGLVMTSVDCKGGGVLTVFHVSVPVCWNLPDIQLLFWVWSYNDLPSPALVSKQRERQLASWHLALISGVLPENNKSPGRDRRRWRAVNGCWCEAHLLKMNKQQRAKHKSCAMCSDGPEVPSSSTQMWCHDPGCMKYSKVWLNEWTDETIWNRWYSCILNFMTTTHFS